MARKPQRAIVEDQPEDDDPLLDQLDALNENVTGQIKLMAEQNALLSEANQLQRDHNALLASLLTQQGGGDDDEPARDRDRRGSDSLSDVIRRAINRI